MIFLMQILNVLNKRDRETFVAAFSDLSFELEEMGWSADPETLINDMMFNHFGITLENPKQLSLFTEWVIENQGSKSWQSALTVTNLRKGA